MNYADFIENIQKAIDKKVTHVEIAEILNCSRANISKKVINEKSEVTVSELIKVQEYFGVPLIDAPMSPPVKILNKDLEIEGAILNWGQRLDLIAKYNGFSDYDMAKILNIKETRYNTIVLKSPEPKISELNAIKANFNVSIDEILYDSGFKFSKLRAKIKNEKISFEALSPREKEEFKRFLRMKNKI